MIHRKIFIGILFCICTRAIAQGTLPIVDSLQKVLTKQLPDSTRALVLAELAYRYYTFPDSGYAIAKRGLHLAKAINFERGIANNELSLGNYYSHTSDFVKALELVLKSFQWQQKHGTLTYRARSYLTLGIIQANQGSVREAISSMKSSCSIYERSRDSEGQLLALNNLGYLYTLEKKYDSAFMSLKHGIRLAEMSDRRYSLISLTGSLAELYLCTNNLPDALLSIKRSIRINENHDLVLQAYNYNILARIYLRYEMFSNARKALEAALKLEKRTGHNDNEVKTYEILHDLYLATSDCASALTTYKKSIQIKEELFSEDRQKKYLNLLRRFELDEKESQIKILEQARSLHQLNLKLKEDEITKQNLYIVGTLFIFGLVLMLLFLLFRQSAIRKRYIHTLQEKKNEIERKARQLDEANQKLESLNHSLEIRANEIDAKIEAYAFLNSHKLRAPIASLLGLLSLVERGGIKKNENDYVLKAFKEEVVKIDKIVYEISRAIE